MVAFIKGWSIEGIGEDRAGVVAGPPCKGHTNRKSDTTSSLGRSTVVKNK